MLHFKTKMHQIRCLTSVRLSVGWSLTRSASSPHTPISVGVLEDKSSSSRILEDNFEVLGLSLGLESRVLGLGLVTR